jgi:hypothetical protein
VPSDDGGLRRQATTEIVVPVFGYKNHVGIDRAHGFIRRSAVTHAAAHDGGQLEALLDRDNLALLDRRGLVAQFQRAKPRGEPMPAHIRRGNATRAKVRATVGHVFAAQKRRLHLVIRTIALSGQPPGSRCQPRLQHAPPGVDRGAPYQHSPNQPGKPPLPSPRPPKKPSPMSQIGTPPAEKSPHHPEKSPVIRGF